MHIGEAAPVSVLTSERASERVQTVPPSPPIRNLPRVDYHIDKHMEKESPGFVGPKKTAVLDKH